MNKSFCGDALKVVAFFSLTFNGNYIISTHQHINSYLFTSWNWMLLLMGTQLNTSKKPETLHEFTPYSIAFLAKALADENRVRIIISLTHGKKTVSAIVDELGISQPLASHHLKELKRALLVTVERSGPFIYYELVDLRITTIVTDLGGLAADLLANRTTF
jgi:DNA-binding transcriptional ArsR family regulator